MPVESRSLTYLKLLIAMAMWGGTWVAGRVIVQELSAPLIVNALRFLLAGVVIGISMLAAGQTIPLPSSREDWLLIWGLGFFGIFLYGMCFFFGLQHITAGRGALVVALNPVAIIVVAWLSGKEKMSAPRAAGCLIAFLGCLTVIGNGDPWALMHGAVGLGEYLILGCVAAWTTYTFIGWRSTRRFSAQATTLYASFTGAALLGLVALWQGDVAVGEWSWRVWAGLLFLAICGTAIAYTWFTAAVQQIGAGKTSVFINLVPVFAVLQAAWLLDERVSWAVLFGGALVIAGVLLSTVQKTFSLEKTA
ncbi:DMT family transporter [Azonexus sp.]|uniref:DMT family transporter n=1 Tax=Azonexus sp. TaxID=1872668 RepID=UPI0039E6C921